jgi:hypothetical protein
MSKGKGHKRSAALVAVTGTPSLKRRIYFLTCAGG